MKKCDSCGKLIADSKDVMCPFCGAVSNRSTVCTHEIQEDRWNRSGSTYSFHGEKYKTDKTLNEPEVNINKMFSFGSETPREKHTREQKYKKTPIKKSKSGKKTSARTVVLVFVLLSAFISFFSNTALFSDIFNGVDILGGNECVVHNINVKTNKKGSVFLEFPDGLKYYDNDSNDIIDLADENEITINEIPYKEAGNFAYDGVVSTGMRFFLEKTDGNAYRISGFYVCYDDSVIVLSDISFSYDGKKCDVILPFDAVRINGNEITYLTVDYGEYGEAVFTPYESGA